jgi:hypothetical protein
MRPCVSKDRRWPYLEQGGSSMSSSRRSDRALALAAVAVLGFVITPVLHAEEHRREGGEIAAVGGAWRAGSSDPLEKLAYALEHAHDAQPAPREGGREHGHSHGPASGTSHGAGVLAHLGLALHAAPRLPEIAAGRPDHLPPAAMAAQLSGTLRYLVPEGSQGPPIRC